MNSIAIDKEAIKRYYWKCCLIYSGIGLIYLGAGVVIFAYCPLRKNALFKCIDQYRYSFDDSGLTLTSGAYNLSETYVPYSRIASITKVTGPILRASNIQCIQINTGALAGNNRANLTLLGVDDSVYALLKSKLV